MPTYVYACQGCRQVIERRQTFSDDPLTVCEQCGGQLRKVIQAVGIIRGNGSSSADLEPDRASPIAEKVGATSSSTESSSAESSSTAPASTAPTPNQPSSTESSSASKAPAPGPAESAPSKDSSAPTKEVSAPAPDRPSSPDPDAGHRPPQRGSRWTTYIR